jgi:hypothetical protein
MVTLAEIASLAMQLPEGNRAKLVAGLLDSLPGVLLEVDDRRTAARRKWISILTPAAPMRSS